MTIRKRLFDLFLATSLIVLLSPVLSVFLVLLMASQGRPIFFVSERMKTPETAFSVWKFRTIGVVSNDAGVSGGDKVGRITPIGAMMRRFGIDGLPGLWNVVKGDMSIVGPKPPMRRYVEIYPDLFSEILKSRPGMFGLASVVYDSHANRLLSRCVSPEETDSVYIKVVLPTMARIDLLYQRHCGICFDIYLIFKRLAQIATKNR